MNYTIRDVQEKVDNYLGEGKSFKVNPKFSTVENLRDAIEKAVKKGCATNRLKYQMQFNQVIDRVESAILSSSNWFDEEGLNFDKFRQCLNIKVEKRDAYLNELELRYNISGEKNEKHYDIKEIIAVGQSGRYQQELEGYFKWYYLKSLRLKNIQLIDNSDAYQDKKIDLKVTAKGALIKGFDNGYKENTTLIGLHYHSYSEEYDTKTKETDYCCSLEKFELVLLV